MLHLITEASKYIMILLFVIYTWYSFTVLLVKNEDRQKRFYKSQTTCMVMIHLVANMLLVAVNRQLKYLIFYAAQVGLLLLISFIYRVLYRRAARLVLNHMCMLLIIGFVILGRLNFDAAVRQFEIAAAAVVLSALVPILIRKFVFLKKFTWLYAILGIGALGAVLVLGKISGGAHLSFTVAGITLQPSEIVKIIFVFFVACRLSKSTDFKQVCITTVVAAIHVIILVLSTDLGAALIFFMTYIIMLYVATRKAGYFFGGLGAGAVAALGAAKVFSHVRVRIQAWQDPLGNFYTSGNQVSHALFAIGTGGWFGLGLYQGLPNKIPIASSDFVFAALTEEMGIIFSICLILVCFSCLLMFLNIAMQIHDIFYKMIALGLGSVYGVQVFLNIGGVIKLIPSTGITLPLISYGGSSILCTIIMFAIIQGLYIKRQDEGEEIVNEETRRKRRLSGQEKKADKPGRTDHEQQPVQNAKQPKSGVTGAGSGSGHRGGENQRAQKKPEKRRVRQDEELW